MVDVDREEVQQVAVAGTVEAIRAELAEVVWLGAYLDTLEVRARVQRVLRLTEVNVPNRRRRLDVRIDAAVRLVVNDVNLAGIARDHPREDRRIIRLWRQVDRRGPSRAAVRREGVVDVLLAFTVCRYVLRLRPGIIEVAGPVDRHLNEDVCGVDSLWQVGDLPPGPAVAAVRRLRDVELPCAGAVESLAPCAEPANERDIDIVRRVAGAHCLVRDHRPGHPEDRIGWVGAG